VSAATPDVCGAAIDVPDRTAAPLPVPMPVDRMLTPGAVTSGFSALSPVRGPADVKSANARYVGFGIDVGLMVTDAPSAARNLPESDAAFVNGPLAPRNGIVTVYCSPVSGSDVIWPSNGGRLLALLAMITAIAPAFWPRIAFETRAQTPRLTTTIIPAEPA